MAIKVLPEHFVDDPDSLTRFQAEAKAIAALSHPNIVAIFDTGEHGDQLYVVTELLEGETLRSRLRQGPFGMRKAAEHAARVAQGLAAAHEKGIVHRDIKPENLFLLNDGRIKILDFGLAWQDPLLTGSGDLSSSPTAGRPTNPGAMIGTVGYLSPEQAQRRHRRPPLRHLLAGRRALRDADRDARLQGHEPGRAAELGAARRAGDAVGGGPAHPARPRPDRPPLPGEEAGRALPVGARPRLPPRQHRRHVGLAARGCDRAAGGAPPLSAPAAARRARRPRPARRSLRGRAPRRRLGPRGRRARGAAVVPAGHRPARRGAPGAARSRRSELRLRERHLGQPRHLPAARGRPQPAEPHARQPRGRHARPRSRPTASGSRSAPSGTAPGAST